MKGKIGIVFFGVCVGLLGMALDQGGAAESYPSRAITMIVPLPPGGVADLTARPLAAAMEPTLKQPVAVVNKSGAGGLVGIQSAAVSRPDGYTIMLALSIGLVSVVPISRCDYFIIGFLTSACLWIVYAVSWDLLGGYTGMLNFGQMLFVGVAGYTVALIELHFNIPRLFMILAGVAGGTLSSLLISLPAFRVRASYFAVVSLVLPLVFHRVTMTFTSMIRRQIPC